MCGVGLGDSVGQFRRDLVLFAWIFFFGPATVVWRSQCCASLPNSSFTCLVGSLQSVIVGVFTPWQSAIATNQGFFCTWENQLLNIYEHTPVPASFYGTQFLSQVVQMRLTLFFGSKSRESEISFLVLVIGTKMGAIFEMDPSNPPPGLFLKWLEKRYPLLLGFWRLRSLKIWSWWGPRGQVYGESLLENEASQHRGKESLNKEQENDSACAPCFNSWIEPISFSYWHQQILLLPQLFRVQFLSHVTM